MVPTLRVRIGSALRRRIKIFPVRLRCHLGIKAVSEAGSGFVCRDLQDPERSQALEYSIAAAMR